MLHVHVLLVAPLCPGDVPQSGAYQHQSGVPVRETTHHARSAAGLPVEPLYDLTTKGDIVLLFLMRAKYITDEFRTLGSYFYKTLNKKK